MSGVRIYILQYSSVIVSGGGSGEGASGSPLIDAPPPKF